MAADDFLDLSITALYHHERGRVYRPTRTELQTNSFSCPHCGVKLVNLRIRMTEKVLSCPSCKWSIHRDDLWSPKPDQAPEVRGPGEATGNSCPVCSEPYEGRCRCRLGNMWCRNKHHWHTAENGERHLMDQPDDGSHPRCTQCDNHSSIGLSLADALKEDALNVPVTPTVVLI